jgi:serine/threonine-protein kinase RsbT
MHFEIDKHTNLQVVLSRVASFTQDLHTTNIKKSEIQTIVSELIYNIQKYTPNGVLQITTKKNIVDIVALDTGGGIKNINNAFLEGYSTGGSLGLGLPAIIRMSDEFEAHTSKSGTNIYIKKRLQ